MQLCPRPRWASEFLCDLVGRARKNRCAFNSATLQCAEQAFQRGNAAKLNQRAGVVGQNDAFVNHKFSRLDTESTLRSKSSNSSTAASLQ